LRLSESSENVVAGGVVLDVKKAIDEKIEQMREEIVEFTSTLIQFPSVQGEEKNAQLFFADALKKIGCQVDVFNPNPEELKAYEDLMITRQDFSKSPDVVGVLKGTGGGKSIILNSHMDVVPAGDQDWKESPWSGKVEGGKIFGRGASDMKGGAAANYFALKAIIESEIKLKGEVIIESVVDEETGGAGTAATLLRGYTADTAIISEPTDMRVYPACMGSMWFRIKVKGKAAHGATAYLGINAIEKAQTIYKAVKKLEEDRKETKRHSLYSHLEIPFCINIGKFFGGNWPSSVPDEVIMEGRMGVSPDESIREARKELEDAVCQAAATDSWICENPPMIEWFGSCWVGGAINKDHPMVQNIVQNHEDLLYKKPVVSGAPWATDAGVLIKYGNIPAVIYGPGKGSMAHQTNEYIDIEDIIKATKVISKSILDWCLY